MKDRIVSFFSDFKRDMKPLALPTKKEVYLTSIFVILVSLFMASFFAITDFIFISLIGWILV